MIDIDQFKAISASIIALFGFVFGIWKHFENRKLKRKAINQDAYLKVVEVVSSFTSSADKCLYVLPSEKILSAWTDIKSVRSKMDNLENETQNDIVVIAKIDKLLSSAKAQNLSLDQIHENELLLSKLKQNAEGHKAQLNDTGNVLDQNKLYLLNGEIDKEFEKAINTLISNLESDSNWKLFSSDKAVALIKKIIDDAKSLRFEFSKVRIKDPDVNDIEPPSK